MVNDQQVDALILGAGAAGLAAAHALSSSGLKPCLLEARDRIGGRIFTHHDRASDVPIELGAEFIHGQPPEIFDLTHKSNLPILPVQGERWCSHEGQLQICESLEDEFEQVMGKLPVPGSGIDESFADFLGHFGNLPEKKRKHVWGYIEGFEAADPEKISAHALARENHAADQIQAYRSFRLVDGYYALVRTLSADSRPDLHLQTIVQRVEWTRGRVEVTAQTPNGEVRFRSRCAVITLPLSVLKAPATAPGVVSFSPPLTPKQGALAHLEMGPVIRVVLRFRERFWERIEIKAGTRKKTLDWMSFLHSDDPVFPTWWTTMPRRSPLLTGWSAGPHCAGLVLQKEQLIVSSAMETLSRVLHQKRSDLDSLLEAHYLHDWQADPFARGAYSWATVGGLNAAAELAKPLENTLFFAGEATDSKGHNGTVNGAMASGYRAASEVLRVLANAERGSVPAA